MALNACPLIYYATWCNMAKRCNFSTPHVVHKELLIEVDWTERIRVYVCMANDPKAHTSNYIPLVKGVLDATYLD